ncbi:MULTISPECIES: type VI secretion system tip protein VgrG [unclassified Fibrobacter]|uniref:type VI secretion system tip protein VgrG n=1 Tax=unclassified Fibrobacter TaxID=2634177 RepID=UPI00091EA8FB|nr:MULTISPECIES: type VI secretion system tip protein VgrG [Fibrobacter]MCL4100883.1 hypothetical protein [Fibrobacter succinogenes]MCQ2098959.1 type VI secretion system tip protein VgrG [Fibrobacter sp.]SHK70311.1 Rhs element Vgr protein [Fibrobacter sp. UWH6]
MPNSPFSKADGVVECAVFSKGKSLQSALVVISADIIYRINGIAKAVVVVDDGYMREGKFPLCEGDDLKPGNEITIKAGYGTKMNEVFTGIIVKLGIFASHDGRSYTKIECRHKAIAMTCSRKNANYLNKSDDAIVGDIFKTYGINASTTIGGVNHKELLQYYCTDWDFVMARAEANGCWLIDDNDGVSIKKIATNGGPSLSLTWGTDIIEFDAYADATHQVKKTEARAWDVSKQDVITGKASLQSLSCVGNLDNSTMAKVLDAPTRLLQINSLVEKSELDTWAEAEQLKNELSRICGSVTCIGTLEVKLGGLVKLNYLGDRFNGNALVSGIQHHMEPGRWCTKIFFGMEKVWHVEKFDVEAPTCSGYNCGVSGLLTGVVIQINDDPDKMNRVKVKIPLMQNQEEGVWARLGGPYASNGVGCLVFPEVGDEVILGFFNADPSSAVILGSLYSANRVPPQALKQPNNIKMLLTREKMSVEFNEEKKSITIKTPGNRMFVLDDDQKKISLDDSTNTVELSDSGVKVKTSKDVTFDVTGKFNVDAKGGINLNSKGDLKGEGMNVNLTAQVGVAVKGNASAEISASGQTTVKGAMVMIN